MDEVYDLYRHEYCIIIHIGKTEAYIKTVHTLTKENSGLINAFSEKACITYNKQKTKILHWGDTLIEKSHDEEDIEIKYFMNKLYHLFKRKNKSAWDESGKFLIKAVSDFLSLATKKLMEYPEMENKSFDSFHYMFIVPSRWEEEIREDLIRPIFIQANLITREDHKDRLLFISDLESICYSPVCHLIKKEQNTIMCRIAPVTDDKVLIILDLIITTNTLFGIPNSMLFPKIVRSDSFYITSNDVKGCIKNFLVDREFYSYRENSYQEKEIVEAIYHLVTNLYKNENNANYEYYENNLMKPILTDTTKWKLNKFQKTLLDNIRPIDICTLMDDTLFHKFTKNILQYQFTKNYEFLIVQDGYSSKINLNPSLEIWIKYMLMYNLQKLSEITTLGRTDSNFHSIHLNGIISGAEKLNKEAIKSSNIYCPLQMISLENQVASSAIFLNSKPDAIINIDISFKSTLLSYTVLNEEGLAEKTFDCDYFIADKYLPSLEKFYDISNELTLRIKERFIFFADKYLQDDFDAFFEDKDFVFETEAILYPYCSVGEKLISTQEQKYIKAFLLMYLVYIKEIISSKLPNHAQLENTIIKIGYAVSIEKNVLDNIIGSKEDLQQLIYTSGLINKADEYKKLRIITQGEGVLSTIQQLFNLKFPIKSYFVLAQLYEDYIQLTLNQVITTRNSNDAQQEAIIIEDKIIPISNIYDSLCLNMWNNLMQNSAQILFCDVHKKSNIVGRIFELFSMKNQNEFVSKLKKYISDNILAANANFQYYSKISIQLNHSCSCKVYLTVNDIISISLKPLLKHINCVMLSSIINEDHFGKYTNIKYHFSVLHLSCNTQFRDIMATILKKEAHIFTKKQGIETLCMIIKESPNQLSQLLLLFLYKGFQKGTLYGIYNKNYACTIYEKYKKQELQDAYRFLKKIDSTGGTEINRTFYFDKPSSFKQLIAIDIYEYETSNFSDDEPMNSWKLKHSFIFRVNREEYAYSRIPFIITVKSLEYSSSLHLSAKFAGKDIERNNIAEVGKPITLYLF